MSDTITITGNVATHPECKRTPSGVMITTFRVASALSHFDRATGIWVDDGTNWYSVSAFRGLADHAFQSLHKGDRVVLTGRLRLRQWESGDKRGTAVEIDASAIGHDLLWGTSTFVKSGQVPNNGQAADNWATSGEESEWATPGVGLSDADSALPELTDPAVADLTVAALSSLVSDAEAIGYSEAVGRPREKADAETPF